jgi:hypothetical protein
LVATETKDSNALSLSMCAHYADESK